MRKEKTRGLRGRLYIVTAIFCSAVLFTVSLRLFHFRHHPREKYSLSSCAEYRTSGFLLPVHEKERRFLCDLSRLFSTSVRCWWRSDATSRSVPTTRSSLEGCENFSDLESRTIRMCRLPRLCCTRKTRRTSVAWTSSCAKDRTIILLLLYSWNESTSCERSISMLARYISTYIHGAICSWHLYFWILDKYKGIVKSKLSIICIFYKQKM